MAVAAGSGPRDRQVGEHLNEGDEARELDERRHVAARPLAQPIGLHPEHFPVPPHDRIGGVLGVDEARKTPRAQLAPIQVCAQVGWLINEAHAPTVVDDGGNLGAALVAGARQLGVHRREGGGSHPQGPVHLGERFLDQGEDRLRGESPQGFAADEERGSVGLVHRVELGPHRSEERGRGFLRRLEAGQPVEGRGHVGVLERGRGAVSARQELEGLDLPLVDPAGAGRRGNEDDGSIEGASTAQLGHHRRRGLLDAHPTRGHTGVDADRLHGLAAGDLGDVEARGATPQEDAPLPADGFPGDGRGRGCGALGHERLVDAARGARVHLLSVVTEEADPTAQDHVGGQEEDDDSQDHDAHDDRRRARHVAAEHADQHASHTVQGPDDQDEAPGDDNRAGRTQEVLAEGLPRHVHEPGGDAGPAVGLDDRVEPPDSKEGGDADAEADLNGLGCADRQAGHGDDASTHILDDDTRDVPAGHEDARGDRVPRPRARHQRRRHAHRVHGEGGDHSQKRHSHGPHCARRTRPIQERHEADGPTRDRIVHELGECACHHFPIEHTTFQLECPEHASHEHIEH